MEIVEINLYQTEKEKRETEANEEKECSFGPK